MSVIGIIGAMDGEIVSFCRMFNAIRIDNSDFYEGKCNNHNIIICKCGIGKVNAAICTQKLIDSFGVEYIINSGIAGSVSSKATVFDVVISSRLTYHDFSPREFLDKYEPYCQYFKADEKLVSLAKGACDKLLGQNSDNGYLKNAKSLVGTIVSGDCFINSEQKANQLHQTFDALCTEMEGAAVAHAALREKIPFVVIRAISDFANSNADFDSVAFERLAADNAAVIVHEVINNL